MIARAPAFWWRPPGLAATLLAPVGALVGAETLRRMGKAGGAVPVPVICVGNPTVGGAGKTPAALALLDLIVLRGGRPFALSRGHGGTAAMPVRVDPVHHTAADVGDEPLLLARRAPTIVAGSDRLAGARLAVAEGATHVVMDDGFQNPSLTKDVSVLVVDRGVGVGNGRVLPAGPLRAPLAPQLARADLLLVVGEAPEADPFPALAELAQAKGCAAAEAVLEPDPDAIARLKGRPLLAFAGIGRPEKFFEMLARTGLDVAERRPYPDHHLFTEAEITALAADAKARGLGLVTTTKDAARLAAFSGIRALIEVVPVTLRLADEGVLARLVATAEARAAARRGAG
ncbi:tetraacyldisaccharide 4'-kinase [Xanthobacter tagetidis]|jgi:tetraacyldisaccharide 4'-kinase|uniref:Tetraacyldisaccharide 4'-kinase n=1 Tax=Xanthobacter tagetidis TaxID=60216 RepID=A0A3L7A654_9HYPH|nr:tetraacyldisaccharide 4'-kinase [Xanthobacter tagetidis]MBB6307258.1 tetraacyldisaccharide 4'-kinase [Xanthobacter tagetidis]RLP75806.1 tetraacyldisaccharide 4'-kinase [Xanthobacter tagetidis]